MLKVYSTRLEMMKTCPLLGMVVEEGRPSPVCCRKEECAIWDKEAGWCGINSIRDALWTIAKVMEAGEE